METLDAVRRVLRRLGRRPGVAATVVVILALGIGVSTAVFSVVEHVLARPIPAPDFGRLVVAWETDPAQAGSLIEVSLPYFQDFRAQSRSFDDLAAFGSVNWSLELKGPPQRETVPTAAVSASFFTTLRVRPALGRAFLPEEDDPAVGRVVVLSHALWQRRFAGDPAVVGKKAISGDDTYTIVGVMPGDFDFPRGAQLWTPVGPQLEQARRSMAPGSFRGLGVLYLLGRLKGDVTLEAARTELSDLARRLSLADGIGRGWGAQLIPLVDHHLGTSTRRGLEALAAASGLVLLLACANAAVILLVRSIEGRADLAVRRALGASPLRVALHQLAETLPLACAGGLAGAFLARGLVRAVVAFGPSEMPGLREAHVGAGALGFALLTTLGSALFVTLAPLWLAFRLAVAPALKAGSRGMGPDRRGLAISRLLVSSEVALSIALLVGCSLMVRSLHKLLHVELGFVANQALSFSVAVEGQEKFTKTQRLAFHRALLERLRALPAVEAAGATHLRPLEHGPIGSDSWVLFEGQSLALSDVMANSISVTWQSTTPGYFRAVGTRLLEGRDLNEHDTADAPKVVIVSAGLARRCWPGERALGKRLHTVDAKAELKDGQFVNVEWQTVVGVVEDARYRGIQNPRLDVYLSEAQTTEGAGHFVVRTPDPLALVPTVREQVRAIDPDAAVENVTALTRLVDRALAPWRFTSALLVGFAAAALLLTASGLFAVLHQFVSGRTREIAIRMALGADPLQVRTFVLGQGFRVAALGAVLGLGLALALARSLSALLFGVHERDPWSYLGGLALIVLVGTIASLLPAHRAARVEPNLALRSE